MGVPSLFKSITDEYPDTVRAPTAEDETDLFYIDFNAIIHRCCNNTMSPTPKDEKEIFSNIQEYLNNIIKIVKPKFLVYISTDGVAPRAKLNQQRARRYMSSMESCPDKKTYAKLEADVKNISEPNVIKDIEINKEEFLFESNSITPGTDFMKRLDSFMDGLVKYNISNHWNNLSVIYSPSDVPGEGEQKILEFIRSQKKCLNMKHTIYSPDADIIFLGLSLHKIKINIMRNDQALETKQRKEFCKSCQKKGHSDYYCNNISRWRYLYFDVEVFKRHIYKTVRSNIKKEFVFSKILDDWIFLCFMAGNDFVPSLQCFDIRFGALENIFYLLCRNFNQTGLYITENGRVDFSNFNNLLYLLSKFENKYYFNKLEALRAARKTFFCKFPTEEIWLHTSKGKEKYYQKKLNATCSDQVEKICKDYLSCLSWVCSYYYTGVKIWDFYYPHHYSPFASDLAKISEFQPEFKLGKPLKPLEQLMLVMPPLSKDLLPKPFHKIFEEFKVFYPDEIKIDMFDKLLSWQGIALLPFLDSKLVLPRIKEVSEELSLNDIYKNIRGHTLLYVSDSNQYFETIYSIYLDSQNNVAFNNNIFEGKISQYHSISLYNQRSLFLDEEYHNKSISAIFELIK